MLSSSFLFVRAWQFITTNFLWYGLVLGCLGFVLVFNSPGLVGVEVASGSPMLLGVETELKFEAELRNLRLSEWCEGVSISGHENFESSARILYLLLLLVTSGGENIFWEKLGLSHPSSGQNHIASTCFSCISKVLDPICKQSLCSHLLQLSQQSALHSQVTASSQSGHRLTESTEPLVGSGPGLGLISPEQTNRMRARKGVVLRGGLVPNKPDLLEVTRIDA